jgi:hypothetical protein
MVLRPEEKRQFPRINLRTPIRYQIRGNSLFDHAVSDNISLGGLSYIGNTFIAPSTALMLEINILSKILRPVGKIIWSQPLPHSDRNRLGIEFLELDLNEKSYLADFISMHTNIL